MSDWSHLKRGDRLSFQNKEWRVELVKLRAGTKDEIERVAFLDIVEGHSCALTPGQLSDLYRENELEIVQNGAHPEDVVPLRPEALDSTVAKRLYYTRAFDRERPSKSTAALGRFIDEQFEAAGFSHTKPSPGSVRRWVGERGVPGQRHPSQMRGRYRRGPRGMRIADDLSDIIQTNLERYFRSRE